MKIINSWKPFTPCGQMNGSSLSRLVKYTLMTNASTSCVVGILTYYPYNVFELLGNSLQNPFFAKIGKSTIL
jgi:hypothetical protein